ncbi:MAG: hypothetical protein IPN01_10335 [Deltaproteobacteria bacterium]|nr:hypothetical protein [Deltaproteobacteria bacterium]
MQLVQPRGEQHRGVAELRETPQRRLLGQGRQQGRVLGRGDRVYVGIGEGDGRAGAQL